MSASPPTTTYVVAGASRGIGYEFLRQLILIPDATVFGLARDISALKSKIATDETFPAARANLHLLQADLTDRASLSTAAAHISKITGQIDILINNGAFTGKHAAFNSMSDFTTPESQSLLEEELLSTFKTNVIGVVNSINAFLPLIQASNATVRKVVTLSSDLANDQLTNDWGIYENAPYSISKAAVSTVVAKYNARFGPKSEEMSTEGGTALDGTKVGGQGKGVLFVGIHPGIVATVNDAIPPPDSSKPRKFTNAYPNHFAKTGPLKPETSVKEMLKLIEGMEFTEEYAGKFLSHYPGTKWAF